MGVVLKCGLIYCSSMLLTLWIKSYFPFKNITTSWEDLKKLYPHLQSIESKRKRLNTAALPAIFTIPIALLYMSVKYSNKDILALIFLVTAIAQIVDGWFSLSNSIYSSGTKSHVEFYYDENKRYTWVAKFSIGISVIATTWIAWILINFFGVIKPA